MVEELGQGAVGEEQGVPHQADAGDGEVLHLVGAVREDEVEATVDLHEAEVLEQGHARAVRPGPRVDGLTLLGQPLGLVAVGQPDSIAEGDEVEELGVEAGLEPEVGRFSLAPWHFLAPAERIEAPPAAAGRAALGGSS